MLRKWMGVSFCVLLFAFSSIKTAPNASTAQISIQLNPNIRYQTITGWEAESQSGELECPGFDLYKDQVFDLAVNDLGINRLRVAILSGAENPVDYFTQFLNGQITRNEWKSHWHEIINDNANPNVINAAGFQFSQIDYKIDHVVLPLRNRLQQIGKQLYINMNYVDFGVSTFEHKDHPEEYAEFVLATYQHMQSKYGFVPDAWEVILEPDDHNANWSPTQIGQAIKAAGDLLKSKGFTPRFIAPSTKGTGKAITYFRKIIAIPGVLEYFSELSYHRYVNVTQADLQTIASLAVDNGVNTAMLEHIGSSYEDLHEDLKVARNSAWQEFTLAYCAKNDNGGAYYLVDNSDPAHPIVRPGSRTLYLGQYFKHILKDAVRIDASSTDSNFDPLAFINPNGFYTVVVKADAAGDFQVQGLPPGTYESSYTTESGFFTNPPVTLQTSGQALLASIPAKGVISVYRIDLQSGIPNHHFYLHLIS